VLNEDKIKLMTELALYEKKEKKALYIAGTYFKKDYIHKHLLQSFFSFTVGYVLITVLLALYGIQFMLSVVNIFELTKMFKIYIFIYFFGLILYELLTVYIYARRYDKMKKKNGEYILRLTRLNKRYDFGGRSKELAKEDKDA
jgi:hypothetical protein